MARMTRLMWLVSKPNPFLARLTSLFFSSDEPKSVFNKGRSDEGRSCLCLYFYPKNLDHIFAFFFFCFLHFISFLQQTESTTL